MFGPISPRLGGAHRFPLDVYAFLPGIQSSASQIIVRVCLTRASTFPANFADSCFTATVNATGSTTFDVQKNGSSVGSIVISAASTTATFSTTGGQPLAFNAGDVFSIVGPATADATLANCGFSLLGYRDQWK